MTYSKRTQASIIAKLAWLGALQARSKIGLAGRAAGEKQNWLGCRAHRRREAKLAWLGAPQARSNIGLVGRAAGEKQNWLGWARSNIGLVGRAAGEKQNWLGWVRRKREAKLAWLGVPQARSKVRLELG
jgi:RNase P/RNase MRP subunit p29